MKSKSSASGASDGRQPGSGPTEVTDGLASASQRVLAELERGFRDGRYAPGQRLVAGDLAADLGMSRAPVREAFHILAGRGVLELTPNRGVRIRELGAGLSLDDFGTGHSSLAYLQRFPFDTIKIDQSFVRTTTHGTRPVILRSIISLAHDLGMEVVAEGAETDSDAVELYQLGCEYAQGFAFGEAMTSEAALDLLLGKPPSVRNFKLASE